MTQDDRAAGPLAGVRVLDLSDGKAEMCGRYLADLGADVVLVEPPAGASSRRQWPVRGGQSLYFETHNANKRSLVTDFTTSEGRATLLALAERADILIETARPGEGLPGGLTIDMLLTRNPMLVVVSISDFGASGPYRDYTATSDTHLAMAGVLCRSGLPGLPPLLPPGDLAYESAAVQAAWSALLAYVNAQQTGQGDHIDFSVFEATAQIIDPGLGVTGSAANGGSALDTPRGRPDGRHLYPIIKCADGYVRICVLSPRQWRAVLAWLGEPEELLDPQFDKLGHRFAAWPQIRQHVQALFQDRQAADLVAEGQRLGVPVAKVLSPGEVLQMPHFEARGAFTDVSLGTAGQGRMPSGYAVVDGERAGVRAAAPRLGEDGEAVTRGWAPREWVRRGLAGAAATRPLAGLRILDLGVIVAGAETGRLFADQGADVIKIESRAFPDGSRQSLNRKGMSASFAQGHRGKRSLGLDLRSREGHELFLRLVRQADVVLSNFKPGTMDSLGLGYETLSAVNPRIVVADSSALGASGPWAKSMGYGPLVRASSSLTWLWRYPDEPDSFSDGVTIFPDHLAARVVATAVLAKLAQRACTGRGGTVSVSQAEVILMVLSHQLLLESVQPGSMSPRSTQSRTDVSQGVYQCAGGDEWCVIDVHSDEQFRALCAAVGMPQVSECGGYATAAGRLADDQKLDKNVREWVAERGPADVVAALQAAGVPAGKMQRLDEYLDDPQFQARGFIRYLHQPQLASPLPTENGPSRALHLADPDLRPAPVQGEHTREIAATLLGLAPEEIDRLTSAEVLQPPLPAPAAT